MAFEKYPLPSDQRFNARLTEIRDKEVIELNEMQARLKTIGGAERTIYMKSPNGQTWAVTISNAGVLTTTLIV